MPRDEDKLKLAGLCTKCGKNPSRPERVFCQSCADKDNAKGRKKNKLTKKASRYYQNNKVKYRNWRYVKKYGITLQEYDSILKSQNGVCAICQMTDSAGRELAIDHNHNTGLVRGLLCTSCNSALGHFKDNVGYLVEAMKYLGLTS